MPLRGSLKSRWSIKSRSPNPLVSPLASITRSPNRGPGGMLISLASEMPWFDCASSSSYAFRRALLLAWRARGDARTQSSSCLSLRWRALSCFSSTASRADFCSSQPE